MEDEDDAIEASNTKIGFLLSLDEWRISDAVQIIENIDPDYSQKDNTSDNFCFKSIRLLNGDSIPEIDPHFGHPVHYNCEDIECERCENDFKVLQAYSQRCSATLKLLEKPSEDLTYASPQKWIERALSKNRRPVWLDWAVGVRLYKEDAKSVNTTSNFSAHTHAKTRDEQRVMEMVEAAILLGYTPTSIPYGGKQAIKQYCVKSNPKLFTDSTFDSAWKKNGTQLIVASHEQYVKKP